MTAPVRSVLIVEDERIIAKDLQQTLVGLGYDAFAIAASAEEAIAKVSERRPDVVLMDIRIKGQQDGIETAEILRSRFDVAVIYLTAHADERTLERAKATEPHGYLLKPVNAAELRSVIEIASYRHEMDRRLRQRERWFSTTLRAIGDAVLAIDLDGCVSFLNPGAEVLVGASGGVVGRPVEDVLTLFDGHGAKEPDLPLREALRERCFVPVREGAIVGSVVGQPPRAIAHSAAPIIDEGRVLGAVMVFRDITVEREVRRRLEVADRLTSLATMARGVAHEINNPLAAVTVDLAYVTQAIGNHRSKLREGLSPGSAAAEEAELELDGIADALQNLSTAAGRIGGIVRDMRAFARPAEKADGAGDVNAAVAWALRAVSFDFRNRARLVTDLAESLPAVDLGETRLGQVFVNLLINAAQAIEPGASDANEVRITTRLDAPGEHSAGGAVVIDVRDTGCGIPAEVLGRLFEPFYSTKPTGVGTGLGLSICHGIVTSAGGRIQVESTVGRGSLFRIVLPATLARERTSDASVASSMRAVQHPMRRGRILAVDDDEMVLGAIRRTLAAHHDLTTVGNARAVLEMLASGAENDLILCDLTMPDMSGIELYQQIATRWPERAARVVFLTGGSITAAGDAFLRGIPNIRIDKPFDAQKLRQTVANLLAKYEAEKETR